MVTLMTMIGVLGSVVGGLVLMIFLAIRQKAKVEAEPEE